jgi:hypothetical protein
MDGGSREWKNVVDNSDNEDLGTIGDGFTFP